MTKKIYLDYNASTSIPPEAVEALLGGPLQSGPSHDTG